MTLPPNRDFANKAFAVHRLQRAIRHRISLQFACFLLLSSLLVAPPNSLFAGHKPKTDKFEGYVVAAGPKSITVKNKKNIYHVRTFNYSPKVEQQIMKKKPEQGKIVTVHYTRGTEVAVKLK